MEAVETIGLMAAVLTTISFVPQVYKAWRTRNMEGVSLVMYLVFFTGVVLWYVYGVLIDSFSIKIANAVTGILVLSIIFLKIAHRPPKK